jgi:septum formation protein
VHSKAGPIILASASPRRSELLPAIAPVFSLLPPNTEEAVLPGQPPELAVLAIAEAKGRAVQERRPRALILAADTLVVLDGVPLGKPRDAAEAEEFLLRLRGRAHNVLTAVKLLWDETSSCRLAVTRVRMRSYSDVEIARTIASGVPFDKAGAYGIQDPEFRPVDSLTGCYCNVMGLPLWDTRGLLLEACPRLELLQPQETFPRCDLCPRRAASSVDAG